MARARVLVIDDEPQFLEMLTEDLTLAGHEVATGCGAGGSARLTGNADGEVGRTTLRWGAAAAVQSDKGRGYEPRPFVCSPIAPGYFFAAGPTRMSSLI